MKHNNQHIFKKSYAKPAIEEVMLDYGTILMNPSTGEGEFPDPPPEGVSGSDLKLLSSPDYGTDTYKSTDSPF